LRKQQDGREQGRWDKCRRLALQSPKLCPRTLAFTLREMRRDMTSPNPSNDHCDIALKTEPNGTRVGAKRTAKGHCNSPGENDGGSDMEII
jgi:hypothetical protein